SERPHGTCYQLEGGLDFGEIPVPELRAGRQLPEHFLHIPSRGAEARGQALHQLWRRVVAHVAAVELGGQVAARRGAPAEQGEDARARILALPRGKTLAQDGIRSPVMVLGPKAE